MLTMDYISEATRAVTNPRKSVELAKSGQLYVPTVRLVVKDLGNLPMEALVRGELLKLNSVLNLARPMNETMIKTTASLVVQHILEDDCDITLADIRIIFERAMKGYYGEYFNGIGSADVIKWVNIYVNEKCDEYERWHQNRYSTRDTYERSSSDTQGERNAFHDALVQYEQARLNNQNEQQ